jgi:hypothetical protein
MQKRSLIWRDIALDSGGFVALNKWGDFPFTPDMYLNLVNIIGPKWAASMDFPCEPSIAKGTKLTVNERITATVDYAVYLTSKSELITPVLQGYTALEYEECWRLLSAKIQVKRLAIGSICKRQSTAEISTLCYNLRQFLPDIPIHGFGVKLRALAYPEVWSLFSSIDTNAWEFHRRGKSWAGTKLTDAIAWKNYFEKVEKLKNNPRQLCLKAVKR